MMMHKNSLDALRQDRDKLNRRAREIIGCLVYCGGRMTDRRIMEELGYKEPNSVRPRITELIRDGIVEECGSTVCPVTGKTVREVHLTGSSSGRTFSTAEPPPQMVLGF